MKIDIFQYNSFRIGPFWALMIVLFGLNKKKNSKTQEPKYQYIQHSL